MPHKTTNPQSPPLFDLVLVGCGSMGSALLTGWLQAPSLFRTIKVVTPSQDSLPAVARYHPQVTWHQPETDHALDETITTLIVFAVKPHIMPSVLSSWVTHLTHKTIMTTVAAGLDLSFYESIVGEHHQIIRIMPNTPVAVQKGMSLLLANKACQQNHQTYVDTLMTTVGDTMWCQTDDELDRFTTISGCGPAFLFAFTKALQDAAIALGASPDHAHTLAYATVEGSAHFMKQASQVPLETLMSNVASPGGMTAQGLAILAQDNALTDLLSKTTKAAYQQALSLRTKRLHHE